MQTKQKLRITATNYNTTYYNTVYTAIFKFKKRSKIDYYMLLTV